MPGPPPSLGGVLEVSTDPPGLLDPVLPAAWDPTLPTPDGLAALVQSARTAGVSTLVVAAHPCDEATEALLSDAGFTCMREMLQLRRPLPAAPPTPDVEVRPFDEARDRTRWLEVNRRAFAWHPDQGHWTGDDLDRRLGESWFDPAGFLVHDGPDDTGIDAFCWTKVHPATADEPAQGEIFVIAVDPDAHGGGLGRAMVLAGLDHLHRAGLRSAMLFVEADNAVGRHLYDSLGFLPHDTYRWYRRDLHPS